jgi:hypothetical protein
MTTMLFLDFDGVTHPEPCRSEEEFCTLHMIEGVLREFPAVEVVISSSWREHYDLDALRAMFSFDMGARVVDVTPVMRNPTDQWLPGVSPGHERECEIQAWMKANRPWGTPWLAIDDRPQWFTPECRNLLVTERKRGFRFEQIDELREMILERQESM